MTRPRTIAVRLLLLSACFLGTAALATRGAAPHPVRLARPLSEFPLQVGEWTGTPLPPFTPEISEALGADDYVNRLYVPAEGSVPVSLYVGYYESQQAGDSIHSPLNCLPGAGWQTVVASTVAERVPGRAEPITINRLLIEKGAERQVVLYWYQSHGRVLASDYVSKAYLVYDGIRLHRSDAAIVRLISPVMPTDAGATAAENRARTFLQAVFPSLDAGLASAHP